MLSLGTLTSFEMILKSSKQCEGLRYSFPHYTLSRVCVVILAQRSTREKRTALEPGPQQAESGLGPCGISKSPLNGQG